MALSDSDRRAVIDTINLLCESGHMDEAGVLTKQFGITSAELNAAVRD
jgi:hypothetical protein